MAVKVEWRDRPAPSRAWLDADAPIAFLRFSALGARLAVEAAKVVAQCELDAAHAPARYGSGMVMLHGGEVIPLVDFRSAGSNMGQMLGAPLLIVLVHGRAFGIAVDAVQGRTGIAFSEIRPPGEDLSRRVPCLAGLVWREGSELYLIDSDRLLGPAVRTHLLRAE